jgi:ATP-dependent RNA helicase DeaD
LTDEADSNTAEPDNSAESVGSFKDMNLAEPILRALEDLNYQKPTLVQWKVFDPALSGSDVIVQSKTGSGKTAAFCLPLHMTVDPQNSAVQAIVLCPTRELANQVATEASRIGRYQKTRVAAVYGGASIHAQIAALEAGAQIVVGTPGRVLDLIRRGHLKLKNSRFAVLDEADEMLSMGFWEDVTSILDQLGKQAQTLLFSATLPSAIETAAAQYLKSPVRVDLSTDAIHVDTIRHIVHLADENLAKPRNFLYLLETYQPRNAIAFCNRRDETEMLTRYLQRFGYRAEALNGDMPQRIRERVLKKVKNGELNLMVATDVAARGIDISDLAFVFNYDLPEFNEVYIHRVGRTGRIGKQGTAVSLVRGRFLPNLSSITRQYNVPFEELELPDEKEILWMQAERLANQLVEEADSVETTQYRPVAEAMLERGDIQEILAFLLRSHYSLTKSNPAPDSDAPSASADTGRRQPKGNRKESRDSGPRRSPKEGSENQSRDRDEGSHSNKEKLSPVDAATRDGSTNIYVSLGRQHGFEDLNALVSYLGGLAKLDTGYFGGRGTVRDTSSHVEIDRDHAEALIAAVHGQPLPATEGSTSDSETDEPPPDASESSAQAAAEDSGDSKSESADGSGDQQRPVYTTILCEPARPRQRARRFNRRPRN